MLLGRNSPLKMLIDLHRTFSVPHDSPEGDSADWSSYFGQGKNSIGWEDLHERPVTVVVGEAGIGKTFEFKNECLRMQSTKKASFFVALNQLVDTESWQRALVDQEAEYAQWRSGTEIGFFFLDAVDESRLKGQAAFENALIVVRRKLSDHLARVRIVLSSRWTDWNIEGVRSCVEKHLTKPIEVAQRAAQVQTEPNLGAVGNDTLPQPPATEKLEPYVVSLEPLSKTEAARFADALGVVEVDEFWGAVEDGSYEFMATRPLDLQWMVALWNTQRSLGTYQELIEANIANRLTELNLSYQSENAVLSLDQLRAGAEELAAATEFSSRPFISTETGTSTNPDEVSPQQLLQKWKPNEISLLLASAVFDEATYGRVKFHHRSIREYLAACWVKRQLLNGVTWNRLLRLFCATPFGDVELIPTRRASLCWLAAIDVAAREWVTRYFPEMLLFEGDPEAWDEKSADQAFMAYVQLLCDGHQNDWYNNASEFRRVGRRLPPGRVAGLLANEKAPSMVKSSLLSLAKHGRLHDCADVVFNLYSDVEASLRERGRALNALETLARSEHREAIRQDLLNGALTSNELVAAALEVIDWPTLGTEGLSKLFLNTEEENRYSNGAMSDTVKSEMAQTASVDNAEILLTAVLRALPRPETGKRFARFHEADRPVRAWLLDVLPDCFERLLTLLPTDLAAYPDACLEAAERIEALRNAGYTDHDEFTRLHELIAERTALRWQIAIEIAQSEDITHATSRLTWGTSCIVSFLEGDLPELIARANEAASTAELRGIWFTVALEVAFRRLPSQDREAVIAKLKLGPELQSRTTRINTELARWNEGIETDRRWKTEELARKLELRTKHELNQANFLANIGQIADATHKGTLQWLAHYSYNHSENKALTRVDYVVIERAFGKDIASALASGLKQVWSTAQPPNPADYQNGEVPWVALMAMAGLQTMLDEGLSITSLTEQEAARAAQLAVWELNGPPAWFEGLARTQSAAMCGALHPWIVAEAQDKTDTHRHRGAIALALNCPPVLRALLLQPLLTLVHSGQIGHPRTLKEVVKALRADDLAPPGLAADVARTKIIESIGPDGLIGENDWLRMWLEEDTVNAWEWFETHVASMATNAGDQVKAFAGVAGDCKWVMLPADGTTVDVLLRLHAMLTNHLPPPCSPPEGDDVFGHPISRLREAIPSVLVQSRGVSAHQALMHLASTEAEAPIQNWLKARVREHSAIESLESARVEPSDLISITSPFWSEPRTESQLFDQVFARLEEIRTRVEEGPFSDRLLFGPNIPEKHLQLWLASRFRDTPNLRFSVHREEEVDDDKKTDIQLSTKVGTVCVEIKPVDRFRSYSATTLTKTLQEQIVDQYLKGENSRHGILILFRLDTKVWDIPDGAKGQSFDSLVQYLQVQADAIRLKSGQIQALTVFGINCVA